MASCTLRSEGGENNLSHESPHHQKPKLLKKFEAPERLIEILSKAPVDYEEQVFFSWNPKDCSPNIRVKEKDILTCRRDWVADSTDCIRGKVGFEEGFHVWEICWPTQMRGTNAVVGVATENANLQCDDYKNLVGYDSSSWGWDIVDNKLLHNSRFDEGITYPAMLDPKEKFKVPDKFLVALDMDEGTLSFVVNGEYLGPAFHKLHCQTIYPIISTTRDLAHITMRYIGGLDHDIQYCKPSTTTEEDQGGVLANWAVDPRQSILNNFKN